MRFYTAIVLTVMVLNISKYNLPYIEYNLFKEYIAGNLCVKRSSANNTCQGKCFLEKQINHVNETDHPSGNTSEKIQINEKGADDYITKEILQLTPVSLTETTFSPFREIRMVDIFIDIPLPPPKPDMEDRTVCGSHTVQSIDRILYSLSIAYCTVC
ncbi:MAG: hypothetical protein LBP72_03245 [Dysgonamonadaceae bacterium]|jgi:hypothetical protein|nr:hypothetical protein [Dysgonamonadaceae bacterium]